MTVYILPATDKSINDVMKRCSFVKNKRAVENVKVFFKRSSFAWVGFADDEAACAYGLIAPSFLNETAYLWLLTNDLVDKHQFSFVRHSQIEVRKMLAMFPRIIGHVQENEERSKKWLKWLGVRLGKREDGLIAFELRSA